MNAPDLLRTIREQPFEPLLLEFAGGRRELVQHPDNIMVIGSSVTIAQFDVEADEQHEPASWAKKYSLRQLISVEPASKTSA